jgi:uncharacterized membrane protein YdjX (TVP38/TMEM64 family)
MTPGTERRFPIRRAAALALILAAVAPPLVSWWSGGIVATLLSGSLDAGAKLEALRAFVLSAGPAAPIVYLLAVVIEVVVAPLPGLMLYAPGGAIFGGPVGGLLSLAGNVIGAAVAFFIARALGGDWLSERLGEGRLADFEQRLGRHGLAVVFLLRVNPLTSSDLVSYAAGLTSMPAWKLVAGTAAGMAPLSFLQSYAAAGLVDRYPGLIYGVALLAVGYLVAIAVVVVRARSGSR